MNYTGIPYAAFGEGGEFVRQAVVIHELPTPAMRQQACADATTAIASALKLTPKRSIPFGAPVHLAFGITRPDAKKHAHAPLLLTRGCDVPLIHCG